MARARLSRRRPPLSARTPTPRLLDRCMHLRAHVMKHADLMCATVLNVVKRVVKLAVRTLAKHVASSGHARALRARRVAAETVPCASERHRQRITRPRPPPAQVCVPCVCAGACAVCVCMCMCVCVCVCARVRTHVRTHANKRPRMHTHAHARARTHARTHVHAFVCACSSDYDRTLVSAQCIVHGLLPSGG